LQCPERFDKIGSVSLLRIYQKGVYMKPFEELEFCDGFLFAATLEDEEIVFAGGGDSVGDYRQDNTSG